MESKSTRFKHIIEQDVFVSGTNQYIESGKNTSESWIFDFRTVLLRPQVLNLYAELFFEKNAYRYPFQVGGLEVAAIPLVAAIVMKSIEMKMPVNGFFIRKSRKKTGRLNIVEGQINNEKIILVDDIINTGGSFIRQLEILQQLADERQINTTANQVCAILRFRDMSYYTYFADKKIPVESFFELNEFKDVLPVANQVDFTEKPIENSFTGVWHWRGIETRYQHVLPKSAPIVHTGKIYFSTDRGDCMCLEAQTGKEVWRYQIPHFGARDAHYSTPCILHNTVFFGGSDGNVYALNAETGVREWVSLDADWIDSSPALAENLNLLFINLEFGLFKKQGALVALDTETGSKKWEFRNEGLVHASPAYSKKYSIVYSGSHKGVMYALEGKTGKLLWSIETLSALSSAPCVDETHNVLIFGGINPDSESDNVHTITVCDLETGTIRTTYTGIKFGITSTPLVYKNTVIVTALDKYIHAFDILTGAMVWKTSTQSRIFSSPRIFSLTSPRIYVGANNAILYEIEPETGTITSMSYVTERITNAVAFDEKTNMLFLPTYANEIYALKKKP